MLNLQICRLKVCKFVLELAEVQVIFYHFPWNIVLELLNGVILTYDLLLQWFAAS